MLAGSPALALLWGSGEGCAAAVTMVDSPSLVATYLKRMCSITLSLAGA
jgi:hypothetical protein